MYIYPNKDRCIVVCLQCGRVSSQSTLPDWSDMRPIAYRDMLYGFCVDCTTRAVATQLGSSPRQRGVQPWSHKEGGVREHETIQP